MVNAEPLIARLQQLIADAVHKQNPDPLRRAYWQGVRFGLETALAEFTSAGKGDARQYQDN